LIPELLAWLRFGQSARAAEWIMVKIAEKPAPHCRKRDKGFALGILYRTARTDLRRSQCLGTKAVKDFAYFGTAFEI